MTKNKDGINSSQHLSSENLLKYHRKQLSDEDRTSIESHFSGCELCSDALNGMKEMNDVLHIYNITHELRNRLKKRNSIRKKIFSQIDLITIVMILFILGLLILIAFYIIYLKW